MDVPREPKFYSELMKYLKTAKVRFFFVHPTVSVSGANFECTRDLGDYFLSIQKPEPIYLENNGSFYRGPHVVKSYSAVAFINSVNDIQISMRKLCKMSFFHPSAKIHIIICKPVLNYNWIKNATSIIWHVQYLNYVLVFTMNDRLEVIGYNPFNKTILNFTDTYRKVNIFYSKIRNVYGYELKVVVLNDIRNPYENGRFIGQDGVILSKLIEGIKAKPKYLIPNTTDEGASIRIATAEIQAKRADFSFITRVLRKDSDEQRFTYPHEKDDVVIMVRKSEPVPQYLKILLTFKFDLWIAIIIYLLVEVAITFVIQRILGDKSSFSQTFLHVYVILLNISFPALFRKVYPVKILLVFWSYFALILYAAFSSAFISTLIVPKSYNELDTIEDIHKAGYDICISEYHAHMIQQEDHKPYYKAITKDLIFDYMLKGNTSCAYALPRSYMLALIKDHVKNKRNMYHMAAEHIIPSLGSYIFPEKSPFLWACEKVVVSDREFGFMAHRQGKATEETKKNKKQEVDLTVLTLGHLQTGFYVLVLGYLIGGLTFGLEQVCHRLGCSKRRRFNKGKVFYRKVI